MWRVRLTRVQKQLAKLPLPILQKVLSWVNSVEEFGLPETRKSPGLHDEPLKGKLAGYRSIRLNRSWRLIYEEKQNDRITILEVQEIHHHDY